MRMPKRASTSMARVIRIRRDWLRSGRSGPYYCAGFTEIAPMTSVKCTEGGNFPPSVADLKLKVERGNEPRRCADNHETDSFKKDRDRPAAPGDLRQRDREPWPPADSPQLWQR